MDREITVTVQDKKRYGHPVWITVAGGTYDLYLSVTEAAALLDALTVAMTKGEA